MPESTYAHESGGDPRRIPDLSYEQFVDFHRSHYHPSNATLFFYGDADLLEELAFVQERFLSKFDQPVDKARIKEGLGGERAAVHRGQLSCPTGQPDHGADFPGHQFRHRHHP